MRLNSPNLNKSLQNSDHATPSLNMKLCNTAIATLLVFSPSVLSSVCPAPQCDTSTGYLCGVCDPNDPQICTVGGTQHTCQKSVDGNGGGVSSCTDHHDTALLT